MYVAGLSSTKVEASATTCRPGTSGTNFCEPETLDQRVVICVR